MNEEERRNLYWQKICDGCMVDLKKRKTTPWSAPKDGLLYFDYYQCPKCKTNFAYRKGE